MKQSLQAAQNVMDDYHETYSELSIVAASLKLCDNEELTKRGLRRINFRHHNYFILYKLEENIAYITNIFHGSEDYENKLK